MDRVYDTRFFWEVYTAREPERAEGLKSLLMEKSHRFVSAVTLYEIYKLSVAYEGRDVAKVRCSLVEKDMRIVNVDSEIAEDGAAISHRYKTPMADAIIIATAKIMSAECITDDPHFRGIKEIKTRWI
jgi:predicted nucleic acid-binding protein